MIDFKKISTDLLQQKLSECFLRLETKTEYVYEAGMLRHMSLSIAITFTYPTARPTQELHSSDKNLHQRHVAATTYSHG